MSNVMIPQKTQQGWILDLTPDFAQALGVEVGSKAILYANDGKISYEILPPLSSDLEASILRINERYKEAFAELKRLGD